MSMNISVFACGDVISPSGDDMPYQVSFPVTQTKTVDSYKIIESEDKYKVYKDLYGDRKGEFKKWIDYHVKLGFRIEWEVF